MIAILGGEALAESAVLIPVSRQPRPPAHFPSALGASEARPAAKSQTPKGDRLDAASDRAGVTRYSRKIDIGRQTAVALVPSLGRQEFDVTCIAGCVGNPGTIVYFQPRLEAAAKAPVQLAGAMAPDKPAADVIECLAGCYSTPKSYAVRPQPAPVQQAATEAVMQVTAARLEPLTQQTASSRPVRARRIVSRVWPRLVAPPPVRPRRFAGVQTARPAKPGHWRTVRLQPWRTSGVIVARH